MKSQHLKSYHTFSQLQALYILTIILVISFLVKLAQLQHPPLKPSLNPTKTNNQTPIKWSCLL